MSTPSPEYHAAHLAFARAGIVQAAADRKPILDMLLDYTDDVAKAERDRIEDEKGVSRCVACERTRAEGHCPDCRYAFVEKVGERS